MEIFDKKGMMKFPDTREHDKNLSDDEILVVKECYCQNGHLLIDSKAKFGTYSGIVLKIVANNIEGKIALSPVFGEKNTIALDIDLIEGENVELYCPHCDMPLPVFSPCNVCNDAAMVALFLDKEADFSNSIAICNKVGCANAAIVESGDLYRTYADNL